MTDSSRLSPVLEDGRWNAWLAWLLLAVLLALLAEYILLTEYLRAGLVVVVVSLGLLPPLAFLDWRVTLPWELLGLVVLPVGLPAVVSADPLELVAAYLSVAAVALVLAVELDVFTGVQMTESFAVAFVVIATVAASGIWAVAQWLSDLYVGTTYILDPTLDTEAVHNALMWDFVAATVAGLLAGLIFSWYFRRLARLEDRLPEIVEDYTELDLDQ